MEKRGEFGPSPTLLNVTHARIDRLRASGGGPVARAVDVGAEEGEPPLTTRRVTVNCG